ncbi:glyoxylate reductase [Austwickia chelonae]|uniref:Putative glyoxylate reductase n=1 Tax=Austwickia chelonae NBRC 105200 TaxID=1184607 RepID=K6V9M0_9MICO|nr:D-glycerate dehydrogenase [Austwickia chelonae]GAB78928.1 putative glyoxylate reductase [Austwickia chelonae NBRC 105200]SEV86730.1 glyoxylate reductase [Austwickia chelonae]
MSKIFIANRIPDSAVEALRAQHDVDYHDAEETIGREELLRRVAGADAVVTLLTEKVDEELLAAAGDQLKIVANVAVGYNNIDVPACDGHGVIATNTPKVLTETTADTAFGLMLMATRRFGEGERVIRSGTPWQWGMFYMLGMGLQGKILGIVGMGQIGQAMARRAKAFGMDVVYADAFELDEATSAELGARRVDLDELLAVSDVVSLHCPLMDSTKHLINAESLKKMKKTAYVVNSARGPVVDEAALVEALKSGEIAGAGLDVFEDEPTVHPGLLECENAVLLPHLGSATVETRTAMADLAAQNVLQVLAGDAAVTPVTEKKRL